MCGLMIAFSVFANIANSMIARVDAAMYGVLLLNLLRVQNYNACKSWKNSQFAFNRYSQSKPVLRYVQQFAHSGLV